MRSLSLILSPLMLVVLPAAAPGSPVYSYHFDQANYQVTPGGTVDVRVFLRETIDPGAGDTSLLAAEGLFSAGVRVHFDEPPVPGDPARVLGEGDIVGNPAFDFFFGPVKSLVPGSSAGLSESVDVLNFAGVAAAGGPTTFEVLLGTFRFTAGSVPGQVTRLRATDFSPDDETLTNATGTVLDPFIRDGQAAITVVAAVPEPGSLPLMGVGVGSVLAFLWWRLTAANSSAARTPAAADSSPV
jgi:hypothetical protein